MKKRLVSKTKLPQFNSASPPDLPLAEPNPSWILSGLYTWRHLESRLFRWDRGTFGKRWVHWQKTIIHQSFRPSLTDPGRDAFGEALLFDDPIAGHFGSNRRSLNMQYQEHAFRPADRVEQFLADLLRFGWWDSMVALLDFRKSDERIGSLAELELLSLFMTSYFQGPSIDSSSIFFTQDHAACLFPPARGRVVSASVKSFQYAPWREKRNMPHGLSVPVFDCRKSAIHVVHPSLIESCPWPEDAAKWSSHLINSKPDGLEEMNVREFVTRDHDQEYREHGVSQMAIILWPVARGTEKPGEVLRSLIESIWLSMRETRNRLDSRIAIPDRPMADVITVDSLLQVEHRLDNWLREVYLENPVEMQKDWNALDARWPGMFDLRSTRDRLIEHSEVVEENGSMNSTVVKARGVVPIATRTSEQAALYRSIWKLTDEGKTNAEIATLMKDPMRDFIAKNPKNRNGRTRTLIAIIRAAKAAMKRSTEVTN